jgi:hypothetical protein
VTGDDEGVVETQMIGETSEHCKFVRARLDELERPLVEEPTLGVERRYRQLDSLHFFRARYAVQHFGECCRRDFDNADARFGFGEDLVCRVRERVGEIVIQRHSVRSIAPTHSDS